jgi:hypothetical protein
MIAKLNLLKILTAVSFLLVLVGGEKLSFFIGFYLIIAIFNPFEVFESVYAYIASGFVLYLYISGNIKKNHITDDILCMTGILIMSFFIYNAIEFRYIRILGLVTTSIFILLSSTTFSLILYRRLVK